MNNGSIYGGIFERIEGLKKQIEEIMPSVRKSVEDIINNNVTSNLVIERLLDQMLDYAMLGLAEDEFKRLNRYYSTIDKENALFYEREFKTLQDED